MENADRANIFGAGQYVQVKNSSNVELCLINLHDSSAPSPPGYAKSALVLGGSELAIQTTDGRTLIYDLGGKFLRLA